MARNFSNKYRKQLLDTGLDSLKPASKQVFHKAAGNTIADKIVKTKPVTDENSRNVEEIIILPEKRKELLNELRKVL